MTKATRNAKPAKTTETQNTELPSAKPDTEERTTTSSPKMTTPLSAPKPDTDRAPRTDGLGKKERKGPKHDINTEDGGKDKVYGVSSRARWGGADLHELRQDAAAAEQSAVHSGDQE